MSEVTDLQSNRTHGDFYWINDFKKWKSNKMAWKSKAFSYQSLAFPLHCFSSLWRICLLMYLSCLIPQKGFGEGFVIGTIELTCLPTYKPLWNSLQRNVKEGNRVHGLLDWYLPLSQCDGATVIHIFLRVILN